MATIRNYKTRDFAVTINSHLNGIEIRYADKMTDEQIEEIKDAGFRWSKRQQLWYAYQNDRTIAFANSLIEKDKEFYNPTKTEAKEVQHLAQAIDNPVKEITVNELAELIRQRNELDKRIAEIKRASIEGKIVDLSTQEAKDFAAEVYGQELIAPSRTEKSAIGNVTPADLEFTNEVSSDYEKGQKIKDLSFESNIQSFEEARDILKNFQGKEFENEITGMKAIFSRNSIDKICSGKVWRKSVNLQAHLAAATNIDKLFKYSDLLYTEEGNKKGVAYSHKFYSGFNFNGETLLAKVTINQLKDNQGNRIYSVEAIEVEQVMEIVSEIEKANGIQSGTKELTAQAKSLRLAYGNRITQMIEAVNPNIKFNGDFIEFASSKNFERVYSGNEYEKMSVEGSLSSSISHLDNPNPAVAFSARTDNSNISHSEKKSTQNEPVELTIGDLDIAKKFIPSREYETILNNAIYGKEQEYFKGKIKHVADMGRTLLENRDGKSYNSETQMHDKGFMHYFLGSSDWYICEVDENDVAFGYVVMNGDTAMSEYGYVNLSELTELGSSGLNQVELDIYIDDSQPMEYAINQNYRDLFPREPEQETEEQNIADYIIKADNKLWDSPEISRLGAYPFVNGDVLKYYAESHKQTLDAKNISTLTENTYKELERLNYHSANFVLSIMGYYGEEYKKSAIERFNYPNSTYNDIYNQKATYEIAGIELSPNEIFNSDLDKFINGTLPKNYIFTLGQPDELLIKCGFPKGQNIELAANQLSKKIETHGFEAKDVKNLVSALNDPVAVFSYGDSNKAENVIVELQRDDKNFLVGVHFNQERGGAVVSSIRGLFNKDNPEWLNWITQGKLIYANKEKIQAVMNQQQTNPAEVEHLDLDSVQIQKIQQRTNLADVEYLNLDSINNILNSYGDVKQIFTRDSDVYENAIKQIVEKQAHQQAIPDEIKNIVKGKYNNDFTGTYYNPEQEYISPQKQSEQYPMMVGNDFIIYDPYMGAKQTYIIANLKKAKWNTTKGTFDEIEFDDEEATRNAKKWGNAVIFTLDGQNIKEYAYAMAKMEVHRGNINNIDDIFTEEHHTPSQMQQIREQAKEILSEHTDEEIRANKEMLEVLAQYEGGGGLSNEKERTSAEVLNAFYTPRSVVNAVWQLADYYAPNAKTVLEPSSGIGRFAENRPNNQFTLRELDETSARIAKILHPDADVIQGAFQEQFFDESGRVHLDDVELPKYDIVIGNPPYGENNSIWKGRGEGKNFARIEEYFLDKGLDSLKDENSVLLYVMPSSFLKSGIDVSKRTLAYKGEIIDAYRLPNGAFDSTDVGTDIIVLKKDSSKTNEEWIEKSKDFFGDNWFKNHPEKILGEEYQTTDRYGKEVTQVRTRGANTLQDELAEITKQIEQMKSAQFSEKPYIELRWSEHPELEGKNIRYDFKEFNDLLTRLDKERYTEADGGYDKTRFIIRNLPLEGDDKDYEPDDNINEDEDIEIDDEIDINTDVPDEETIHDKENNFTVEDEIYLNRISEVFGENASMYAERISHAEDEALEFYDDSIQKEGGYSFKEYAAGQMAIGFIIDKYPEIKEINDRGDIGAELDEIGTDIAYGAYTKESLERKLAELAEKYSHEEITARSIATNYVLEKLSKAGIEVVTDKKIFEKILANETRIQKMVESDEKAQENLESIKSIEVANELLLGSVEDKKDAIKNEKKNQKHPDVLSSANMFFYEGLNYVPVRNFETGESRDINSKHRFNGALIKEPSTTKKFLTSDFYNTAEKNGNADVFYCVQQGVLCFPGTNGIFILSNKFNKNQKGKNEFFHDYDTETEEFRNKNEELLIELNNISFEEKNDKELMKSISEVLEYGEIFNRKNETLGDVRIRKGSGVKADGILHIAERRLSKKVFHEKKELEQAFRETTAIIFCAINNVDKVPAIKETNGRWAVYRNGIKTSIDRDKNGYFVITGFDLDSTNKEAADTIEAVNANYGYTPEFLEIYAQVGAAYASLYQSLSQAENLSSEKPQHFIQNNTTYGFAHNGKIYLNPDVMNSEAAVHEYVHLWDAYTQRTNPELWRKGKDIFSHTQLWLDIKNDENYADIADDDDLVLSECHARICGKVAAQVLERIAEQDGEITKDKVIDWDKEVSDYLYRELRELAPEVPGWAIDQKKIDFLAQPMKDLMNGRNILQEVVSEQTPPSHTIPVSQKQKGDILTAEDFSRLYGKNFDKDELAIWAATDWEGKIDTSKLTGNELENLRSNENFVETESGQFTHRVLFTSGDIGAKIREYEDKIAEMEKFIANYEGKPFDNEFIEWNKSDPMKQKSLYQKNISTLEEALPNPIPMEKLHFGVNTTLAEEFELEQTNGNGEVEKINLQESFILWAQGHTLQSSDEERHYWRGNIDWATANVMREEFPENIHWYDIVDYIDKKPVKADQTHKRYGMTDEDVAAEKAQRKREADEKRMARSETADRLFDRFLHEGLSEEDQRKVEAEYNRRFNSYVMPDYSKLPLVVDGMSAFKGDDRFKLYDQQIKGISFLCNKGNGLLAYDVGVGKTAAGIVANVNQLQLGRSKRPLIVVPNSVYTKWYNDVRELFPNFPVNDLYNLNKESTAKFRDSENPHKLNIPEGSISIVTYEALTRNMSFTDESCENELYEDFSRLLSENLDDMSDDRNATERAKDSDKIKNAIGAASQVKNPSYVFFEECGWDNITVDEAHNFKNLWTVPRSKRKGESNEFSGIPTGKPSQRALKLYGITQLVQRNNDNRNVFLLTATPFTNSPLEVYSMMSYVGRQRLLDSGIYSLRDFLTQFAHTKLEIAVNAKGEIDYKQVMKDWKELPALQNMLTEYIDKVDGEEAGIIRPQKFTHVKDLDPTPLQKQMIEADTNHMLEIKEGNSAAVIVSMNAMRLALVAPVLADRSRYEGLDIPAMEQLVETSPKLKFVCDSIIDMYKTNPEKGQFMYMPLGQQAHGVVKDYLVSHGIPKDAVEIINGSINNSTEKKEKVTSRFNDEHDKLKIIIGGKNTSEGIDLNGNSFVMYNCSLGWNPSETIQAEGRIWRQGNMQGHVHCVYPVMNDSIDSVLYQKHDEKRSRINDLWTYKGDNLNVEDIKPEDLKFDLIKDPMKRAKLVLDESTKELKAELSKTALRIKSYDEVIEKKLELTSELEEAKSTLAYQENQKADYESRKQEVPYWLKGELSNSKKEVRSTSQKLETVTEKLERMGIHNDDESQSYIRNMNVQKRELEKQIEMKKEELPDILEKLKLEMLERKITLPSVEEQRKELCSDIVSNLRPMKEVEVEIKQQRFEKMLEKKFQTGVITFEQHELYKAAGYENYQKWLDGEIDSLENISQKTDVAYTKVVDSVTQSDVQIEVEKTSEQKTEALPMQMSLFDNEELDAMNGITDEPAQTKLNYQLITYSTDSGFSERESYETKQMANEAGEKFMDDWGLDVNDGGFVAFNTETKEIGGVFGNFPAHEYFPIETLKANGMEPSNALKQEIAVAAQKSQKKYTGIDYN